MAWKFKDSEKTILKTEISEDFFYDFKCINTQLQNQDEYFYWENSKEKNFHHRYLVSINLKVVSSTI